MVESAGILAFRRIRNELEFFLVHPGGPFFSRKDDGFWTIPKGLLNDGEELLAAAKREFFEETGVEVVGEIIPLGFIDQKGGKRVHCFAVELDLDASTIVSNTFEMVWPQRSGNVQSFPEIDKADWFSITVAKIKINQKQVELLDRLMEIAGN